MSYHFLAGCYDRLTYDVDYSGWADFLEKIFRRRGLPGNIVLDLACGTGSLTWELARRGYETIGVDLSPEMLAQAAGKADPECVRPVFLCQSMDRLDLYGTVDACVCCLDSINYVPLKKLERAFQRVHLFLAPGGVFVFDVNTPYKLEQLDGQVFLDETEEAYCVWRCEYSQKRRICTYYMDIFQLDETDRWLRGGEIHRQYAYPEEQLQTLLEQAGFRDIQRFGERKLRPPRPEENRVFFAAGKEG